MSRTTTALKRLGVPGLAAVTAIAGLPLFLGTAQAAHVTSITLTPEAASAPAGTCQLFTATFTPAGTDTVVDVLLDPRSSTQDVAFCTVASGVATPGTFAGPGVPTSAEFTDTDDDGSVTFGVISNTSPATASTGVVDVTAFVEEDGTGSDNNVPNAGEPADTSTVTFTAGGAIAAGTVDAEPETGVGVEGNDYEIAVTVTDVNGKPLPGVMPVYDVTAGPDASAYGPNSTCDAATNQSGQTTCTVTNTTGAGTDTVLVYVNKPAADGTEATTDPDANDPSDSVSVTFQAAQPTLSTVRLDCVTNPTATDGSACELPTSNKTQTYTALVRNSAGTPSAGAAVTFGLATNAVDTDDTETISATQCLTDANGRCTVTVTDSKPTDGETQTVTATITTTTGDVSDSSTTSYIDRDEFDARFIVLTPETATQTVGVGIQAFTATVTDRFGTPLRFVQVTFTESGTGRFTNGSSSFTAVTDSNGRALAEVTSTSSEAPGTETVTAEITGYVHDGDTSDIHTRNSGTADDECEQPANTSTVGGAPGVAAGSCADSSTVNWIAAASSPSPSPTSATPTPTSGPDCSVTPTVTLEFGTINATGSSGVTVNAPANSQIELRAYSQPSTTYRVVRQATIDNTGTPAQFRIVPPTNTRLYAQIVGCTTDSTRFSKVLNVRTTLSLNVTRTGVRAYRFFGDSLPARPGGLIVSLYRVTDSGSQVLTAQTRADASTGDWVINRVFTGTGRFGFVVRTGQDLQNAPGASNVRSLLIY